MSKIIQVFLGSDLRCSHEGLTQIAKEQKVDVTALVPGEFVIFINSGLNKIKLYTANEVVAYLRVKTGKVDIRTISLIPKAFLASGRIQYDESLKEILIERLNTVTSINCPLGLGKHSEREKNER
jgi:hypothetical protein